MSGVLDEGDSISVFWSGNHTGIYAATHPSIVFHGQAVGGAGLDGTANSLTARFAADAALKPAYVTVLIGANDLSADGMSWSSYPNKGDWLKALWNYVAKWKATGAKVAVGTVLPQCDSGSVPSNLVNANRIQVNAAIRAAVGTSIDAVIDYAADPDIGPDAAACNKLWYIDGLHPTDGGLGFSGGQGRMAKIYTAALDALIK